MSVLTTEPQPAEERRGGEDPDWDNTLPGEPLPDGAPPVPAARRPYTRHQPADWCGDPRCGGD